MGQIVSPQSLTHDHAQPRFENFHFRRCTSLQLSVLRLVIWLLVSVCSIEVSATTGPFFPVAEVQRGMRGYGKTVFHGTSVDTFGVEILGIAHQALGPRRDLILARLSGGPLEQTGIIAGMSGSPVYIDERLVGAVAYGWAFATSPICGITPIADMLEVMERPLDSTFGVSSWQHPESSKAAEPATIFATAGLQAKHLSPLATPLSLTGMTPIAAGIVGEALEPLGLSLQMTPSGTGRIGNKTRLEPGAALGIQFIAGDMSATGIGTVTHLQEDRIVAFGHRLGFMGTVEMPMTSAFIHEVIPNQIVSFKLGAAGRFVGAIRQDRAAAVVGQIGSVPNMLPVAVEVSSPNRTDSFAFELIRHRDLTAQLAGAVLVGSLEAAEKLSGDATLDLQGSLRLDGGERLQWNQIFSGPGALLATARAAATPLRVLNQTDVADARVDSLRLVVALQEQIQTASVDRIRVLDAELRPGQEFRLEVVLQPFRGARQLLRLKSQIPKTLPSGQVLLRVGGGQASNQWERDRRPDLLNPRNLSQLLHELGSEERNDHLVVELYRVAPSLSINGRELPSAPPSMRGVLERANASGYVSPVNGRVLFRKRQLTGYVLQGEQQIELEVVQ